MSVQTSHKTAKKTPPSTAPPPFLRSAASRYWPEAAALLSGVLLALCYPWWDYGGLIWFWSAPLLTALWFSSPRKPGRARWKRGFLLGFLTGFAFFLIDARFITEISHVAGTMWAGLAALLAFAFYLAL